MREEQTRVLASTQQQLNWDALGQLNLLELCIKEAIRMRKELLWLNAMCRVSVC